MKKEATKPADTSGPQTPAPEKKPQAEQKKPNRPGTENIERHTVTVIE